MNDSLNFITATKFLSKYILKHKQNFIMFYFGFLFDALLSIIVPILFGIMIDEIVYYQNLNTFFKISMIFIILLIFSCVLYFFIYAQHHYLTSMYTFDIKRDIYEKIHKCDAQYLSDINSGDMVTMIQWYANECMHFVIRNIIHFINAILSIIVITSYIFIISWKIGLFVIVAAPITVFVNAKFGKKSRKYSDKQREFYGSYIGWIYEMFSGLQDIRMLGATKRVNKEFTDSHRKIFDVNNKSGVSSMTASNIMSFTNLCIQLAIFTFAGYLALDNKITVGVLTIIIAFYGSLVLKIRKVSLTYLDAQNRVSYIQRIYDFMNYPTEDEWTGKQDIKIIDGNIEFNNIEFSYNNCNVILKDLSFVIKSGEKIALVGKSGCGKTTLAYMLIGFYRPSKGEILIDGQKIDECSLKSIRDNIGIIQQEVLMFDGTIKENILLGNRKSNDDEIIDACKKAGIWKFIEELPNGLDTIIGTKGIGLSGGQKQRIAITRIYLKSPSVIIFDEATSALDTETEEQIHKSWSSILSGITSIVIAHRLSSVMLCDKAVILEDGKVCEVGIPQEMKKNSKRFKALFAIKEV